MEEKKLEGPFDGPGYQLTTVTITDAPPIFFRRNVECLTQSEVLTKNAGFIAILEGLARQNPDAVNILTEPGEENIHAILSDKVLIEYRPALGTLEIWLETVEIENLDDGE